MLFQNLLVFGLGRTGIAVAKAARSRGIQAMIVDESSAEKIAKPELVFEAQNLGVELKLDWDGEIPTGTFDAIVVNPAIRLDHRHLRRLNEKGLKVISEIEFAYQIARGPIAAITGTNGKSTTTVMTWLALQGLQKDPILCGNLFGSGYPEQPLASAAEIGETGQPLVAEVSSFQLDGIDGFQPRAAAITNISPDHSDRYPSFEDYARSKLRIFENQTESDWAVIDGTNQSFSRWRAEMNPKPRVLALGDAVQMGRDSMVVLGREIRFETLPFHEPHNFKNAAMALLLASGIVTNPANGSSNVPDVDDNQFWKLVEGLKTFKGLAHRMARIGAKNGITVINNSMCTNPDALITSLASIPGPFRALVGGVTKDLDFAPVGQYLRQADGQVYLYGRDRGLIAAQMNLNPPQFETLELAFGQASQDAKPGDTLILAPGCASQDQFRDFRHRGDVFEKLAKDWLEQ